MRKKPSSHFDKNSSGAPNGNNMVRRNYTGAEHSQCYRPGSKDFLNLPSRIGDRLHYRTQDCINTHRTESIC